MMVRYYVVIQIYLWLKIVTLYVELFPFASDYGNKTEKKKLTCQQTSKVLSNRSFPSCLNPLFQRNAKCKDIDMEFFSLSHK